MSRDDEDFGGETDIGYEPSPPRRPGPTQPPASYVNPFGWSGPPTPEPATPSPPPLTVAEAFQHALWCSYWAGVHSGATGETARETFEAWYRKDVLS